MRITWFAALSYSVEIAMAVHIKEVDKMLLAQTHSHGVNKEKTVFDQLGDDTIEAVAALQMLGGVDSEALDSF